MFHDIWVHMFVIVKLQGKWGEKNSIVHKRWHFFTTKEKISWCVMLCIAFLTRVTAFLDRRQVHGVSLQFASVFAVMKTSKDIRYKQKYC